MTVGSVLQAAHQWVILVLITRLGGLEVGGWYALSVGVAVPLYLVAYLGTRLVVSLDVGRALALHPLYSIRFYMLSLPVLSAAVLFALTGEAWAMMLLLVFLVRTIDGIGDFLYGVAHRGRVVYRQGVSMTLKSVSGLSAFLIGFGIGGYVGGLICMAGANLAVVVFYDWYGSPDRIALLPISLSSQLAADFISHLKISSPILIGSVLAAIGANLPRYVLAWKGDAEMVAVFVAITSFVLALNVFATALGQTLLTRYARAVQDTSSDIWRWMVLSSGLVLCGVFVAVGLAHFYGELILDVTFGQEISKYSDIFAISILCAGVCVVAQTVSYANLATRRFWWIVLINLISVSVGLIAALAMIGRFGVLGGAITMGVIGLVQLTGFLLSLRASARSLNPQ
ncbi:MAG: hypothetical protein AB1647_06895 [Pseudomonadota bacterium]